MITAIENKLGNVAEEQKRFFAIKLLEKDDKIAEHMSSIPDVSIEIDSLEKEFDDDTESIITAKHFGISTIVAFIIIITFIYLLYKETVIVGAIVLGIIILVVRSMVCDKKAGKSLQCGGDYKHCGGHCR